MLVVNVGRTVGVPRLVEGLYGPHVPSGAAHLERLSDRRLRYPFLRVLRLMMNGPRLTQAEVPSDPWSQAFTHLEAGAGSLLGGERDAAERAFRAALEGFRVTGDRWGVLAALEQLAVLADPTGFDALLAEAIDLAGRLGSAEDLTRLLVRNADGLADAGRLLSARAEYERAIEFARRTGTPETQAGAQRGLADVARLGGDLAAARSLYDQALRGCDRSSMGAALTRWRILIGLGQVAEAQRDAGEARLRYRQALATARACGDRPAAVASAEALAAVDALTDGR